MGHLSIYRLTTGPEQETYTAASIQPLLDCGKLQEIYSVGWHPNERLIGMYSTENKEGCFILTETGLITPGSVGILSFTNGDLSLGMERLERMVRSSLKT